MNFIDLKNRTAVITGGAQGFGLAIAKRFLSSGANVIIWDNDKILLEKIKLQNTLKFCVDVTSYQNLQKTFKATLEKVKKIDILVNNAGIAGPNHFSWEYPNDEWQKVMDINLNGIFYCCKLLVPHFIAKSYGRIVNISSIAGKEGNPKASAYSASKAAVIALTKSLGKELAEKNIAVNCITPAAAKTRIFNQISKDHVNYMLSKIPRKRFVLVEELSSLVAWMASEENSFTTGAVFDLSGGRATY
ncbi:MAG: 3-oxoacyl-ACP reductase [Pelagibacteraceae bacterium]|nr:3-oxoacyl-ACP reductase [Pelagibacteraceae bacterium]|tara:strand:+ start:21961 stop:22698 length:738 start_codon:yes stop_codon:yes gene_type:complete